MVVVESLDSCNPYSIIVWMTFERDIVFLGLSFELAPFEDLLHSLGCIPTYALVFFWIKTAPNRFSKQIFHIEEWDGEFPTNLDNSENLISEAARSLLVEGVTKSIESNKGPNSGKLPVFEHRRLWILGNSRLVAENIHRF